MIREAIAKIPTRLRRTLFAPKKHLLSPSSELEKFVRDLVGTKPKDLRLYERALTHASYPGADSTGNNERLEFLGDSIISQIVSDAVYHLYPEEDEGGLSQVRSYIVSRSNMNRAAAHIGLDKVIRVTSNIHLEDSDIPGNALEAFVGAIYLDLGVKASTCFVQRHIIKSQKYVEAVSTREEDYKTEFIILMQKHKIDYAFEYDGSTTAEDNRIIHYCRLVLGENKVCLATGEGSSKKNAHQDAAQKALSTIRSDQGLLSRLTHQDK